MSGERVHLSLDEEAATILDEMEEHLNESYGGVSAFFRTMIKEYSEDEAAKAHVKAIRRKIRKKENELDFLRKELETWENQLEKEKKETKAENIQERIEELKAEKAEIQEQIRTEEQLRQKAKDLYKGKGYFDSEEEMQERIDEWVEMKMSQEQERHDRIQEIDSEIENLQNKEVQEV